MQSKSNSAPEKRCWLMSPVLIPVAFFLVEAFAFPFLQPEGNETLNTWPLIFGLLWAAMLTGIVLALPRKAGRITFGLLYFLFVIYAAVQTGYFQLFREMMWLSDFRYASEGADYADVLLSYPLGWWLGLVGLIALGALLVWKYPRVVLTPVVCVASVIVAVAAMAGTMLLPQAVFVHDSEIRYAGSDYGRAQSAEAAYENMFNAHRLYQVCGAYQTLAKDIYANGIAPLLPGHAIAQAQAKTEIDTYFENRYEAGRNRMTGLFEGKNVVLVLMESMDDWALGEHTPTINRLMAEGINFTNFYTPAYGGVRTFNSEFCANTGSFLSSQGGYAFDYVTNNFRQSLANQLKDAGYSAMVYHYNDPAFYSRGVFSPAMGYDAYLSYQDYVTEENERDLYDDQFLFDNEEIAADFFREGPKLNFIITRSAHLSYVYNEVLSYWGLQKYPEYRGLTGHEEEDCMYLKARLVDDLFARLLEELEANGELENTVIVAMTDHYTYGVDDQELVWERSGVDDELLLEKTPCFIWTPGGPSWQMGKTLNTADLLPTVLNLMGIESPYRLMGQDAYDSTYRGYALFPDGSWVSRGLAYNATTDRLMVLAPDAVEPTEEFLAEMARTVEEFVRINNLILETNYYKK